MSSLPTPPTEGEAKHHQSSRRTSNNKSGKPSSRGSKRTSSSISHEHGGQIIDGRHKRVWKACERCRMKKTKCDGESPCKRCKDDGLVCTAGSRKKTEFKQLPRGYAEVLENTQYALIATVQKLYTMVRNGEPWDLGEPDVNDRGMPVIHNIAEKLGCIRPSPDLPYAFPEDADEFAELQTQMKLEGYDDVSSERKSSDDSVFSHPIDRRDRASSSESDHSDLSRDYSQMIWAQQQKALQAASLQQQAQGVYQASPQESPAFGVDEPLYATDFKQEPTNLNDPTAAFGMRPAITPLYTDFQPQAGATASTTTTTSTPMFRADSPFSPWSGGGDDFLGQSHMLDLTAMYMRQQQIQQAQQQQQQQQQFRGVRGGLNCGASMAASNFLAGSDGTIRPNMLDGSGGFDLAEQMDSVVMFGDYGAEPIRMA